MSVRVDRTKKKKDGTFAYRDECQGIGVYGSIACDGDVTLTSKDAKSFGVPFTSHAYLCSVHARKLGYTK